MIEITQGDVMEENKSSLPGKYELSTLPGNEAPKKMGLKRTLLLPFLASALFFTGISAGCATETERHVRQMKLPKEYGQIMRDVKYYDYTATLLDSLTTLPHDLQIHETTLNYLKGIASDGLIIKEEIDGLKQLDHDGDGLTLDEEEKLGTNPLKPNPSIKYALDKGISYVEGIKKFDEDGVMDAKEQATIDVATKVSKLDLSDDAKKMNIAYLFSNPSRFNDTYSYLKSTSDKALTNMLGLGIDGNVADYISFVSQLPDRDFARYAMESKLCIQDRNLAESEREFLREPNKYVPRMFDEYMSEIGKVNPELAIELRKLPDLKDINIDGIKKVEGVEDVLILAGNPKYKTAFDSMDNEGIKGKRELCTPEEALFFIACVKEFDEKYNPLENYDIRNLMNQVWTKGEDTYRGDIWEDYNKATDRLNSPKLIVCYLKYTFTYELRPKWMRDNTPPKETFYSKKGACMDHAALAAYCLKSNGYPYVRGMELHFDKSIVFGLLGHVVCLFQYPIDNSYYVIDNEPQSCIHGPYKSKEEAANKTCIRDTLGIAKSIGYNLADINLATGRFD